MSTDNLQRKDWLYYRGKFNAFPFKVEHITGKKIGYHAEPDDSRIYYLSASECSPIPLTCEILKRNFPSTDVLCWVPLDTKLGYFNVYWRGNTDAGGEVHLNIRYVHELQHLLKLCGINEEIIL
jgi:hypothetical protein